MGVFVPWGSVIQNPRARPLLQATLTRNIGVQFASFPSSCMAQEDNSLLPGSSAHPGWTLRTRAQRWGGWLSRMAVPRCVLGVAGSFPAPCLLSLDCSGAASECPWLSPSPHCVLSWVLSPLLWSSGLSGCPEWVGGDIAGNDPLSPRTALVIAPEQCWVCPLTQSNNSTSRELHE